MADRLTAWMAARRAAVRMGVFKSKRVVDVDLTTHKHAGSVRGDRLGTLRGGP